MTNDFHKSFIKSLIIIAMITIFAMASTRYLVSNYLSQYDKPSVFTSDMTDFINNSR
jgi:hypothetical protein